MSVMLKAAVPWTLPETVVDDLTRKGVHVFDPPLPRQAIADLGRRLRGVRPLDERLFLSECEASGETCSADAGLLRTDARLAVIERAPRVSEALWSLLGPDYAVTERRVVCHLPLSALPSWLRRRHQAGMLGALDTYVRPEYRDVSYACCAPMSQDVEASAEGADVLTLWVQLDAVGEADGAMRVLEGSHRLGAAPAPYDLTQAAPGAWRYRVRCEREAGCNEVAVDERSLVGEAGLAALWHGCALHGASASQGGQPWFALRLRIARGAARRAGIDGVNETLAGR